MHRPSVLRFGALLLAVTLVASCASGEDAPPLITAAEVPAFTGTPLEHSLLTMECLRDKGWDARLGNQEEGPGTFEVDAPPDQEERLFEDLRACRDQVGRFPSASDGDIRRIYDWLRGQRRCLMAAGYEIEEPPTFEWFVENYNNPSGGWDPMGDVGFGPDYQRALAACPRSTEEWPDP